MKTFTACLMSELSESIIPSRRVTTCYGYTIWKTAVEDEIASHLQEIERFKREVPNRVHVVVKELESHQRLLAFMNEHHLDVIFKDLEQGE